MIYLVITISGIDLIPTIKAFTNKKDAEAYLEKEHEESEQNQKRTGYNDIIHKREIPWKNTKKEFIRYLNHYLQ